MMKRIISVVMLGMFTAGMIGCHASADVDDTSSSDSSYSKKTTEVRSPNGDYQKTETRTDRNP
jgi:hypothetical protein